MDYKTVFGIVPSRRLGKSLGISPIPRKTCNYSCVYCQLGRTLKYSKERKEFISVDKIINEAKEFFKTIKSSDYDVITIVGDGEPTLYSKLNELLEKLKSIQPDSHPIAIISNGSLLSNPDVFNTLLNFDIVMLNFDAWDEESHIKLNRPLKSISFKKKMDSYKKFSKLFTGILYLEVMMVQGVNDDTDSIQKISNLIKEISPQKVFVNAPVRPPAENWVKVPEKEKIEEAIDILNARDMSYLPKAHFITLNEDIIKAIKEIISRHPLEKLDIEQLILLYNERGSKNVQLNDVITLLNNDKEVDIIRQENSCFYRIK